MTTEEKALALVNEECRKFLLEPYTLKSAKDILQISFPALCRAIEAHEAFAQRVSNRMLDIMAAYGVSKEDVNDFIIAKPDPLVEAMSEAMCGIAGEDYRESAEAFRAALASRGLEIRKVADHD